MKIGKRHEVTRNTRKATLVGVLACALLFALCLSAFAQQQKVPRIGYLAADSRAPTHETFRKGLRDLGYVEGKTIRIEWRYAEDRRRSYELCRE